MRSLATDEALDRDSGPSSHEAETRFFLVEQPIIGKHGVIGLLIGDRKPEQRWQCYTDPEWVGVSLGLDPEAEREKYNDPIRRRRFWNTSSGFSLMRIFVLPEEAQELLWGFAERDQFGWPSATLDEQKAIRDWSPLGQGKATKLFKLTVGQIWEEFGLSLPLSPHDNLMSLMMGHPHERVFISFHDWQHFADAVTSARQMTQGTIAAFDAHADKCESECPGLYTLPVRRNLQAAGAIKAPTPAG